MNEMGIEICIEIKIQKNCISKQKFIYSTLIYINANMFKV